MRVILIVGLWALSMKALAEAPLPQTWLADVMERPQETQKDEHRILRVLLPSIWKRSLFSTSLYPRFVFDDESGFMRELNTTFPMQAENKTAPSGKDDSILDALQATRADVVLMVQGKQWRLLRADKGRLKEIVAAPAGTSTDAEGVRAWLANQLEYDGMVLARRGNFLLIGSFIELTRNDVQALLLKNSHRTSRVTGQKTEGVGLVQLASRDGFVGVFQMIVGSRQKSVLVGTKVQIENEKKNFEFEKKQGE